MDRALHRCARGGPPTAIPHGSPLPRPSRLAPASGSRRLTPPCMPSRLHLQTGPYGACPDVTSHEVGWEVKGPAVLPCAGSQGPVADTLLTTDRCRTPDSGAEP